MKSQLLIFLFWLVGVVCSCNGTATQQHPVSEEQSATAMGSHIKKDSVEVEAGEFSFGYIELDRFILHSWEGNTKVFGKLIQPKEEEITDALNFFRKLNSVETSWTIPEMMNAEYLSTLDESFAFYDSAALRKADVCHYRLPDNEAWEFFYSIQKSYRSEYGEYGNLVLYHKKTKKTIFLNVFNEVGGDQSTWYRFFHFDGTTVTLLDGVCYDDGCRFTSLKKVTLSGDGTIRVEEISVEQE